MSSSLRLDAVAQLAAFGVMAVSGVGLNLAILSLGGEAALGVFNQVYAIYVVGGQLAVCGVHDAVLRAVAAAPGDRAAQRLPIDAGLTVALVTGGLGALALGLLAAPLGALAGSPDVAWGLRVLAPGLALFAVDKVLMSALQGSGRLVEAAGAQILRILTLLGTGVALAFAQRPHGDLAWAFVAAEAVTLPVLWALVRPGLTLDRSRLAEPLSFGLRALPHGFVAESFLRVDILMLAPFVDDAAIGIYSLAAMVGEGLYQVGGTLRTVMAPRVVPLVHTPGPERDRVLRTAMGLGLVTTGAVAACIALGFPWLGVVLDPRVVAGAHEVVLVIMIGLVAFSPFLPLDGLLLWAARPGRQSLMMLANLSANVVLNLILVPRFGLMGAAAATACAWAFSAGSLWVAARSLGIRLP